MQTSKDGTSSKDYDLIDQLILMNNTEKSIGTNKGDEGINVSKEFDIFSHVIGVST